MRRLILILFTVLFFFSCGISPPDELAQSDFLDMSEDVAGNIIDLLNDFSAFDYLNAGWIPQLGLFVCREGDQIFFNQHQWDNSEPPESPYIFVSGPSGEVELMQDIYLAETRKEAMLYSFDNITWYATDGDPKEYENFFPMLEMDWERKEREVSYHFKWAIREGKNPKISDFDSTGLQVVNLRPGLVIDDSEDDKSELDLRSNVLFLPKGTLITIDITLDSNFLQFYKTDHDSAVLSAVEDIYLYKKGWMLSASFDGDYWRDTIFAYRFGFSSYFKVNEQGVPVVSQQGYIINRKLLKRQKKRGKKIQFLLDRT